MCVLTTLLFRNLTPVAIALTCRQIELILAEKELTEGLQTGQGAWISKGLKIEEAQYVTWIISNHPLAKFLARFDLRSQVRKLGRRPTTAQKLELTKKRWA